MKLLNLKKSAPADANPDRPNPNRDPDAYRRFLKRSVHDSRLAELRALRKEAYGKLLELDRRGGTSSILSPEAAAVTARVCELLGTESPAKGLQTVAAAMAECAAVDKAISTLEGQREIEILNRIAEEIALRRDEWNELSYRTAKWALAGRALHRARESFQRSIMVGAISELPTGRVNLGGLYVVGFPLSNLITEAVRTNVITKNEAEQ